MAQFAEKKENLQTQDFKELDSDSEEEGEEREDLNQLHSHEDDILKIVSLKFNSTKQDSRPKP